MQPLFTIAKSGSDTVRPANPTSTAAEGVDQPAGGGAPVPGHPGVALQRDFAGWVAASRDPEELVLGVPGFGYADLFVPAKLAELTSIFFEGFRAADPDAVILVGTRAWSSLGVSEGSSSAEIVANPVPFDNIMYTFHFYAASHQDNYRNEVRNAAGKLPLFVSEWGTTSATGGGTVDLASSRTWLDLLDSLKISHVNWTFSDAPESSAAFQAGTCSGSDYGTSRLSQSGQFVRSRVMTADSFPTS